MKRIALAAAVFLFVYQARAQWPARPVEAPTPVEAQLEARHLELLQSEDAVNLREAAERERREYTDAVSTGPEITAASKRIGLVAVDYRNARLARNQIAKESVQAGGRNSFSAAEIEALDQSVAQLRDELRRLLEQRRHAVRANRAAMAEKKAQMDAANAAYRDKVYGNPEYEALIQERNATQLQAPEGEVEVVPAERESR